MQLLVFVFSDKLIIYFEVGDIFVTLKVKMICNLKFNANVCNKRCANPVFLEKIKM